MAPLPRRVGTGCERLARWICARVCLSVEGALVHIRTWRQRLHVAKFSFFSGVGAPAAARGVRRVLDGVALAPARCAPNMFSNAAPTAVRGVFFAVTPLPRLRQALRTTATPRFWVCFEKDFPRHVVAPTAARSVAHVLPRREPSAPRVAAGLLRGATGKRVPNKSPNDVAIIQAPVLERPALEHELCYAWQRMTR